MGLLQPSRRPAQADDRKGAVSRETVSGTDKVALGQARGKLTARQPFFPFRRPLAHYTPPRECFHCGTGRHLPAHPVGRRRVRECQPEKNLRARLGLDCHHRRLGPRRGHGDIRRGEFQWSAHQPRRHTWPREHRRHCLRMRHGAQIISQPNSSAPSSVRPPCGSPICPIGKLPRILPAKLGVFSNAPAIRKPFANLLCEIIGTFVLVFGVLAIFSPRRPYAGRTGKFGG